MVYVLGYLLIGVLFSGDVLRERKSIPDFLLAVLLWPLMAAVFIWLIIEGEIELFKRYREEDKQKKAMTETKQFEESNQEQ